MTSFLAMWLAASVVTFAALVAWFVRDTRIRYGPVSPGNARWRREAPQRAARAERRETLAALTDEDRRWLAEMGWREEWRP